MLRVVVAEVNRDSLRSIGLGTQLRNKEGAPVFSNFPGPVDDSASAFGVLPQAATAAATNSAAGASNAAAALYNLSAILDSGQVRVAMNALRENRLARTLAEPTVTAVNGEEARFHAGGHFPVPVVAGFANSGLQSVDFVPFGVELNFRPTITDRDKIRLDLRAIVSARNTDTGATIGSNADSGTNVPGLDSRDVSTTVQLRDGQTLAIAGLMQTNYGGTVRQVPFLGDIPILRKLVSFDRTTAGEQELVILVTPELVAPVEPANWQPLPGSDVFEPDDREFYHRGQLESHHAYNYRSTVRTDRTRRQSYHIPTAAKQYVPSPRQLP